MSNVKYVAVLGAETQSQFITILLHDFGVDVKRYSNLTSVPYYDQMFVKIDTEEQLREFKFSAFVVANYDKSALLAAFIHRNPNAIKLLKRGQTFKEQLEASLRDEWKSSENTWGRAFKR